MIPDFSPSRFSSRNHPVFVRVAAGLGAALLCLAGGCKKESESKPKPPKKAALASQALQERRALNQVEAVLRELAVPPGDSTDGKPQADATPAVRAGNMLEKLKSVPAGDLPDQLQGPWQEMIKVVGEVAASAKSAAVVPKELVERGTAAAGALNEALAREGLVDFRF